MPEPIRTPDESNLNDDVPVETNFSFDIVSRSRYNDVQLHEFIGEVIREISVVKPGQPSVEISNDIPSSIFVTTDVLRLAAVVKRMLQIIINSSTSGSIKVSAKTYSNLVLLSVKDNIPKEKAIGSEEFASLQQLAAEIGGCVTIAGVNTYCGSLTLSIFDLAAAA
jgi:hypothetical protein